MPVRNTYAQRGANVSDFTTAVTTAKSRSAAAGNIWTNLSLTGREFDVIVLAATETYGQMLTESDRSSPEAIRARQAYTTLTNNTTIDKPVVLWNPSYHFKYYSDVVGVKTLTDGTMSLCKWNDTPGYVMLKGNIRITVIQAVLNDMPPEITLFHELGHVKQYYAGGGELAWSGRLSNSASIEAENLSHHENPICRQWPQGVRTHYKHSDKVLQPITSSYLFSPWKKKALRICNGQNARNQDDLYLQGKASQTDIHISTNTYTVKALAESGLRLAIA